jgi:hypothetical protein
MLKKTNVSLLLSLLVFSSCGIINIRKSGGMMDKYNNYTEELQGSRIQFAELPEPGEIIKADGNSPAIDEELDAKINQIAQANNEELFVNGFTILIYSGVDRERAFEIRNETYSQFPEIQSYMEYEQPRYLVKVGRYINKIEALATYEKMNDVFPNSRIVGDRYLKFGEEKKEEENIENAER